MVMSVLTTREAALAWHDAGFAVIPARADGSKAPAVAWRDYTITAPTRKQVEKWFADDHPGLGLVCGAVSGGLEMLELEGRAVAAGMLDELATAAGFAGLDDLWRRVTIGGYTEASPSGGLHLLFRVAGAPVAGNTKLARRPGDGGAVEVLAETRGEGGFVVVAPSNGPTHPTGRAWTVLTGAPGRVPTISADDLDDLHRLLRCLDAMPVADAHTPNGARPATAVDGGVSPGDDYEQRVDWADILTPHGWTPVGAAGGTRYWRRPGKDRGISATTGHNADRDRLYVFSTATGFESERSYTKLGAFAVLEHRGDHAAAARALKACGYGRRPDPHAEQEASLAVIAPGAPRTLAPQPTTATVPAETVTAAPPPAQVTLEQAHDVFRRWLGDEYDLGALDITLSAAAVAALDGDPVWLMVISGSGNAKTETVAALAGAGAHVTSTISSEGALLSATAKKERGAGATGGLLRKIGDTGILVIKDFTSILSMSRDVRGALLAALREVYDGRWERNVGVDGGRTLTWLGRIVVIGAVTTAYDTHHGVIAAMGDRFAVVRMDSTTGRMTAGRQALHNIGSEIEMRAELAAAAGGLLAHIDPAAADITNDEYEALLVAANLVTLARTAVERDYTGNIVSAHAPEMPTRFAKMLGQIMRGGLALGLDRSRAAAAAVRVARDSIPPLRLAIIVDVAEHPGSRTSAVRGRLQRPRTTVDRELQALHLLGLLAQYDTPDGWVYRLADDANASVIRAICVSPP